MLCIYYVRRGKLDEESITFPEEKSPSNLDAIADKC
jgi:hypothetical protein